MRREWAGGDPGWGRCDGSVFNYDRRGRRESGDTLPYAVEREIYDRAADAIAANVPQAERQVVEGQRHMVDPKALAPVLERFFSA